MWEGGFAGDLWRDEEGWFVREGGFDGGWEAESPLGVRCLALPGVSSPLGGGCPLWVAGCVGSKSRSASPLLGPLSTTPLTCSI